jgi:hypothetical protein
LLCGKLSRTADHPQGLLGIQISYSSSRSSASTSLCVLFWASTSVVPVAGELSVSNLRKRTYFHPLWLYREERFLVSANASDFDLQFWELPDLKNDEG